MCRPVAREFLNGRELDALRLIRDGLPFRRPCRADTPAQFRKLSFRENYMKPTNCVPVNCLPAAFLCSTGVGRVSHSIPQQ